MPMSLRVAVAVSTGLLVTTILAYLGAVALLLARMGIPLGSESWQPTLAEYFALLLIAGSAAAAGGHIAAGVAPQQSRVVAATQAAVLAAGAWWSFLRPASHWPGWWAPALAVALAAGTWLGGGMRRRGLRDSTTS